jgi:hypothetical protein
MPRYLNTLGKSTLAIGVCDRCKMKMSLTELSPDRNAFGLRVCKGCNDQYDPYRLPARATENIAQPFTRPDAPLVVDEA